MALYSLTFELDGLDPDIAETACFEAGAVSLSFTDQRDDPILEPAPGEFRLWPATRLQAIFDDATTAGDALTARLAEALGIGAARFTRASIEERAWERAWLEDFRPMRFGTRLWICPSHASVTETDAVVVRLDPGLAFGTGTHPTTRLCLEWLDANLRPAAAVIDFGCGSGVLAVAAARLDAARVDAHDIDPQALLATQENAAANAVADRIQVHTAAATLPTGTARVVLANILSGPLIELAPQLTGLLAPDGALVLAGLLDEQADEVIGAYAPWLALTAWRTLDGWTCLAGRRVAQDGRCASTVGSEWPGRKPADNPP
ncbi:MAG: 50S ribosomal protein L11 methyltransferase [Sinobacteraceae bacterium]|nr:50S ribosomal protein L11 methyltransferase [Nevskiaceae bacterium]